MAATTTSLPRLARIYWLESKYELYKAIRIPAFSIPSILFPVVFYLFFGVAMGNRGVGASSMSTYLLATYGTFGVVGAALFGFGVGVATERGQGWMLVKRATPMPVGAYFGAKVAMSAAFSAIILGLLFTAGALLGGVRLPAPTWIELFFVLIGGSVPFCAMGLAVGYLAGPNSAPPIVNMIYLPMSIASGLWIPIDFLPAFLKKIAVFLPPYHLAQLALGVIKAPHSGGALAHVIALAGFTVLFLVIATVAFQRDEGKTFG